MDLIDRERLLDILQCVEVPGEGTVVDAMNAELKIIIKAIKTFPTPPVVKRLIDGEELKEELEEWALDTERRTHYYRAETRKLIDYEMEKSKMDAEAKEAWAKVRKVVE